MGGPLWASLVAWTVKHLPTMWETRIQSLGWEDALEKDIVTHSSILARRIPWTEEPGGLQLTGLQKSWIYIQYKQYNTIWRLTLLSHWVMSDSFQPHELQHASLPYPLLFPEVTQTHVHWVSDAIQPSHPLSLASPLALSFSQHQGLFQWVCSSHQVAKVLELSFSVSRKQILKKSGYMYTNNWFTMLYSRKYKTLWINYTPIKIF